MNNQVEILRAKIEGKTFEELYESKGIFSSVYNYDGELFDFDYMDFSGTIKNVNGKAELCPTITIWSKDGQPLREERI